MQDLFISTSYGTTIHVSLNFNLFLIGVTLILIIPFIILLIIYVAMEELSKSKSSNDLRELSYELKDKEDKSGKGLVNMAWASVPVNTPIVNNRNNITSSRPATSAFIFDWADITGRNLMDLFSTSFTPCTLSVNGVLRTGLFVANSRYVADSKTRLIGVKWHRLEELKTTHNVTSIWTIVEADVNGDVQIQNSLFTAT